MMSVFVHAVTLHFVFSPP